MGHPAEFYETACARLNAAGIIQYEISNFAREGFEPRHNLKYWTRQPYLGFGVDAHSMLPASQRLRAEGIDAVRLATTDNYDQFLVAPQTSFSQIRSEQALEESFFLGLRLNRGVSLNDCDRDLASGLTDLLQSSTNSWLAGCSSATMTP